MMKRWLKEPLVHFLAAGGLLFIVFAWLDRAEEDAPRVVRITAAELQWLSETWSRQWRRPPTEQELRGIAADYLREQILALEARELGLDEDDTVVRRRLAQKLEFLVQDTARLADPSEDELRQLYDGNPSRYLAPARISFSQVFFTAEDSAASNLGNLPHLEPSELGDPSLLARDVELADEPTVAAMFGPGFFEQILELEPGRWRGPLSSTYGFHLVLVSERQDAQPLPYDEVAAQVLDDWRQTKQVEATEQFFANLLKKYEVVVDESIRPLVGTLAETPQ